MRRPASSPFSQFHPLIKAASVCYVWSASNLSPPRRCVRLTQPPPKASPPHSCADAYTSHQGSESQNVSTAQRPTSNIANAPTEIEYFKPPTPSFVLSHALDALVSQPCARLSHLMLSDIERVKRMIPTRTYSTKN